jgi:hypothetical protein
VWSNLKPKPCGIKSETKNIVGSNLKPKTLWGQIWNQKHWDLSDLILQPYRVLVSDLILQGFGFRFDPTGFWFQIWSHRVLVSDLIPQCFWFQIPCGIKSETKTLWDQIWSQNHHGIRSETKTIVGSNLKPDGWNRTSLVHSSFSFLRGNYFFKYFYQCSLCSYTL